MAKRDSTAAPQYTGDRPTVVQLIDIIQLYAEGLHEQGEEAHAVALAGEAWAGQKDANGDPAEITSRLIFGAIRKIQEDASNYYGLIDNLNELRDLIAKAGQNGGAR